jgi:hypothetical protein
MFYHPSYKAFQLTLHRLQEQECFNSEVQKGTRTIFSEDGHKKFLSTGESYKYGWSGTFI